MFSDLDDLRSKLLLVNRIFLGGLKAKPLVQETRHSEAEKLFGKAIKISFASGIHRRVAMIVAFEENNQIELFYDNFHST